MSFRITLSPSKRAAGRFIESVRRALQKSLVEESMKRGLTQADIARTIGVNRSVVHRELRGHKDITMGRVAELASAMGRKAQILLVPETPPIGNISKEALTGTNDYTIKNGRAYHLEEAGM